MRITIESMDIELQPSELPELVRLGLIHQSSGQLVAVHGNDGNLTEVYALMVRAQPLVNEMHVVYRLFGVFTSEKQAKDATAEVPWPNTWTGNGRFLRVVRNGKEMVIARITTDNMFPLQEQLDQDWKEGHPS